MGVIDGAYLNNMRLWDIVAGIALLRAAKKETWLKSEKTWIQMENKLDSNLPLPENPKSIQKWRGTIVAGENESKEYLTDSWQNFLQNCVEMSLKKGESDLLSRFQPEFEQVLLETALAFTNGHKQEAAQLLGWGRNTLTRKLKNLDLN